MIEVINFHHAYTHNACNSCEDPEGFVGERSVSCLLRNPIASIQSGLATIWHDRAASKLDFNCVSLVGRG